MSSEALLSKAEKAQLKRLQHLDKAYFQIPARKGAVDTEDEGVLPPIHARHAYEPPSCSPMVGASRGGKGLKTAGKLVPGSPTLHLRNKTVSAGVSGTPNAYATKRKANFTALSYGTNPFNPFEAVIETRPSSSFLPTRDMHCLELVLPAAVSRETLGLLEVDLESFMSENLNGRHGHRVDAGSPSMSPSRRSRLVGVTSVGGPGIGPLEAWGGGQMLTSPGQPGVAGPLDNALLQQHQRLDTANTAAIFGTGRLLATPNVFGAMPGSSLQPQASLESQLPSCDVTGTLAQLQPANISPYVTKAAAGYDHGIYAGYGPCQTVPTTAADDVSLSRMIGERHSNRREVQLMAEWLDGCIASAWAAHAGALGDQSLRAELRAEQAAMQAADGAAAAAATERMPGDSHGGTPPPRASFTSLPPSTLPPLAPAPPATPTLAGDTPGAAAAAAAAAAVVEASGMVPPGTAPSSAAASPFLDGSGVLAAGDGAALGSRALWSSMLQAVAATASTLAQHMAASCFEEGALLARLWNLQTSLMDAEMSAVQQDARHWAAQAKKLGTKVRQLDPLIEWDREARAEVARLTTTLQADQNALMLARSERDSLLRENDKIIRYYRKELKTFKQQQRKDAFRLARKVRIAQEQLVLMQRDREQLISAVSYTKGQATNMGQVVSHLHQNLKKSSSMLPSDLGMDLEMLEAGLKNIETTVTKVAQANQEAEDNHFANEEQVTAMAARDDVEDELVDQVLAGGDPDGKPSDDADLDVDPRNDIIDSDAESEEPEEDFLELARRRAAMQEDSYTNQADDEAAAALSRPHSAREDGEGDEADGNDEEAAEQLLEGQEAETGDGAEAAEAGGDEDGGEEGAGLSRAASQAAGPDSDGEGAASRSRSIRRHEVETADADVQTGEELLEVVRSQGAVAATSKVERETAFQLSLELSSLGLDLGLDLSQAGAVGPDEDWPSSSGREPPLQAIVQGVVVVVKDMQGQLHNKSGELEQIRRVRQELIEKLQSAQHDAQALNAESRSLQSMYARLRDGISRLGIDPDDLRLPPPPAAAAAPLHEAEAATAPPPRKPKASTSAAESEDEKPAKAGKKKVGNKAAAKAVLPPVPAAPAAPPAPAAAAPRAAPAEEASSQPPTSPGRTKKVAMPVSRKPAAKPAPAPEEPSSADSPPRSPAPTRKLGGPHLGKDRVTEKREEKTGQQRLQEAIAKHEGIKPRTLEWLVKLIDGMFKGKATSDEQKAKVQQEPLSMVDYMFQHLAGIYGTRDLVNQYAAQMAATIEQYKRDDGRVVTFQRFLTETWSKRVLAVYLDGMRRLAEAARIPCCDFPAAAGGRHGQGQGDGGPPVADVRKCLWVADKVLMKRHTKTAYAFAAALAVKGEPISEAELAQYFVAPGYYGPDVATMRNYEKSRAEFRRIHCHVFLEALCEEYRRCEKVYFDILPQIFQRWDQNADGFMVRADIQPMMEHMAAKGMPNSEIEAEADAFWNLMMSIDSEISGGLTLSLAPTASGPMASRSSSPVPGAPAPASGPLPPRSALAMLGFRPFMEAALRNDMIRGYVRLYKTPPAKLRMDNTSEEQARLLLFVLVQRHWRVHGPSLIPHARAMGALQAKLLQQVESMEREKDGMRKALALHAILKMMINRKMDRIVELISPQNIGMAAVDPDFEDSLARLTSATKVLYGSPAILVDELMNPSAYISESPVQQECHQRQMKQVMTLYNQLRGQMEEVATTFLGRNKGIMFWVKRWRAKAMTRKQAASRLTAGLEPLPEGSFTEEMQENGLEEPSPGQTPRPWVPGL